MVHLHVHTQYSLLESSSRSSDLIELASGELACLLRRDADSNSGQLGLSKPPYKHWQWHDLGVRIGGPVAMPLSNGKIVAVVRLHSPVRTSVCYLDVDSAKLKELVKLPSGGDTSYAGLVEQDGSLWCSYYSSHEGKTSIYVAQLTF